MESFIANAQFQSMVDTCAAWAFAFLFVWLVTMACGLRNNIPLQAKNRLDSVRKIAIDMANKFTDDGTASITRKDIIRALRSEMRKSKKVDKLLQVYLYDHGESMEVGSARARMGKIKNCCKTAVTYLAEEKNDHLKSQFVLIEKAARDAQELLTVTQEKRERDKLLRI